MKTTKERRDKMRFSCGVLPELCVKSTVILNYINEIEEALAMLEEAKQWVREAAYPDNCRGDKDAESWLARLENLK